MNREARGRYQMTYTLITRDAAAMTPEAVMRSYYDLLEADIRRDPANYLWTHKRWK
jgi:KDO2-lipid IV(A) lauroyltransferase